MDGGEARAMTELPSGAEQPVVARRDADRVHERDRRRGREDQPSRSRRAERKSDVRGRDARRLPRERQSRLRRQRPPFAYLHDSGLGSDTRPTPYGKVPAPTQITDGEFDERGIAVGARRLEDLLRLDARAGAVLRGEPAPSSTPSRRPAARSPRSRHRGTDRQRLGVAGRQADRVCRRAARHADPLVQPARSLGRRRRRPGSTPKNLTADYDFDIAGGIGGDQAAPRGQNRKPIVWSKDRHVADRRVRRERQLEPEARRDRDRQGRAGDDGRARRRRLQRDAATRRRSPRRSRRRPTSATSRSSTAPDRAGRRRRRQITHVNDDALQGHPAERARRDLVQELRRQEHPGLDPEAAGLRSRRRSTR